MSQQGPQHMSRGLLLYGQAAQKAPPEAAQLPQPSTGAIASNNEPLAKQPEAASGTAVHGRLLEDEAAVVTSQSRHATQDVWLTVRLKQAIGLAAAAEEAMSWSAAGGTPVTVILVWCKQTTKALQDITCYCPS